MHETAGILWAHRGKIACLLLGAGLFVVGGTGLRYEQRFAAKAAQVNGMVVRIDIHHDTRAAKALPQYCPVVRFVTKREETVARSLKCSTPPEPAPQVGSPVRVLYDPANPSNAELDTTAARLERWGYGIAWMVFGLLLTARSIVLITNAVRASMRPG
jgi:hypothetical protein